MDDNKEDFPQLTLVYSNRERIVLRLHGDGRWSNARMMFTKEGDYVKLLPDDNFFSREFFKVENQILYFKMKHDKEWDHHNEIISSAILAHVDAWLLETELLR